MVKYRTAQTQLEVRREEAGIVESHRLVQRERFDQKLALENARFQHDVELIRETAIACLSFMPWIAFMVAMIIAYLLMRKASVFLSNFAIGNFKFCHT